MSAMSWLTGWRDPVERCGWVPLRVTVAALAVSAVVLCPGGGWLRSALLVLLLLWGYLTWRDVPDVSLWEDWRDWRRWQACGRLCDLLEEGGIVSEDAPARSVLVRCVSCDDDGAAFEIRVSRLGVTLERVRSLAESSLMAFDAREVRVEREDNRTIKLMFVRTSVYERLAAVNCRLSALPVAESVAALPVGVDLDGSPVCVSLDSANALVAGNPGAGKSVFLSALICQLVRLPGEVVYILSPKALDFQAFDQVARVVEDVPTMLALMDALGAEEVRRREWLRSRHLKKVVEYTPDMPHISVVVDEFSVLKAVTETAEDSRGRTKTVKTGIELEAAIQHLVERGRYVGMSFILTTQRVSADNMSTDLRDLVSGWRVAFALSTVESTRMVMGDRSADAPAHDIPHGARGVGWLLAGSADPVPFKGAYAGDGDEAGAAAAAVCSRDWVI